MRDALLALAVLVAALVVRAAAVASADFPINDGGLFVAMIQAIERNGWLPPISVPWNGIDVPFAYPPLGLYLAGTVSALLRAEVEEVMRVLPLVFSAVAALLVMAIGRQLLDSRAGAVAAGLTYAFAPAAFTWSIAGGGITRAPGIVAALATIWLVGRMLARPSLANAVMVGVAGAATVLTHPASAVFASASSVLLILAAVQSSRGSPLTFVRAAVAAVAVAAVIALPWIAFVVANHGPGVLVDIPSNGPDPLIAVLTIVAARITGLGTDPLASVILGAAILATIRGQLLLPAWLVVSSFIGVQYAIVPASLLVGTLVADGLRLARTEDAAQRAFGRVAVGVVGALLVVEAAFGATAPTVAASHLHALSAERLAAMRWVASNTPESATLAVVTGDRWSTDPDSEWFYVLAERSSVATVQGHEWLGREAFEAAEDRYARLQRCTASASCLEAWLQGDPADYVYIPKGRRHGPASAADCCAGVRREVLADDRFEAVYDGPGATIVRVPDG